MILKAQATKEPAPEPLPGPTAILLSFAQFIKSETIKKYPVNPIFMIIDNSYLNRSKYLSSLNSKVLAIFSASKRFFKPFSASEQSTCPGERPSRL